MNQRERVETVLRGGRADQVPFTIYKWLVPGTPGVQRLIREGLTVLDCSVVYSETRLEFEVERKDVAEHGERRTITRISTPVGDLDEVTAYDPTYGSPWIVKHMIETPEEMRAMRFVLEHTALEPEYEDFRRRDAEIEGRGIVLGLINPIPLANMWVNYMGAATWAETMMTHEEELDALHEAAFAHYRRQIDLAAASPAEFVWLPDNVTASMISPAVYAKYCAPVYDYACRTLHQAGKKAFSHYDGMNRPLRESINATGIDIIEALTPDPMGDMTVAEMRAAWPEKALSLNFPGCLFREPESVIEDYTRRYLEQAGSCEGFAIGCTEDFDAAEFDRAFSAIHKVIRAFEG